MTRGLTWIGLLALLALGCEDASGPSDPVWNKQPCDHCHMLLSEPRFAAQWVTADGQRAYFDDVGCMVEHAVDQTQPPKALWVRQGDVWVSTAQARFASGARTPMGFGFEARSDGAVGYDAVRRAVTEKTKHGGAP
jgi:copper chaperone NosL